MEILTNERVAADVHNLIASATTHLIIVTPYFNPWTRVRKAMEAAQAKGVRVELLLRGGEKLTENQSASADYARLGMRVHFLERLHAKVYLSESAAILTSLNLITASANDSYEIGIKLSRTADADAYRAVVAEVQALMKAAQDERNVAHAREATEPPPKKSRSQSTPSRRTKVQLDGFCIRCQDPIEIDVEQPFCDTCYASWAKYENEDYEESFCHVCGDEAVTSAAKPLCKPCWRANSR